MVSSNNVTITELGHLVVGNVGSPAAVVPAIEAYYRAKFVAERMPEDVQALVEKARGHITQLLLGIPESLHASVWRGEQSDPRVSLIARLTAALEAAYSQKGAVDG